MAVSDGVVEDLERRMAADVRSKYAITDAEHKRALRELGWTPADFVRGALLDLPATA